MTRIAQLAAATALALVVVACAAVSQQKAQPARADDFQFHNLQVLPPNIGHDELIDTMRHFTHALGVKCDHCHASLPGNAEKLDFPSDAKSEKSAARVMIRMTSQINRDYIPKIEDAYTKVSCWTCHRGNTQPDVVPSLPVEEHQ